jgi:outer membrane scaffolding protein for murein synthesis (MipA/OmpV family)
MDATGETMYPLNMTHAAVGFAVANDEAEHAALSDAGYEPKYVKPEAADDEPDGLTLDGVRAALDAAGVKYDKRIKDVEKLAALLPE